MAEYFINARVTKVELEKDLITLQQADELKAIKSDRSPSDYGPNREHIKYSELNERLTWSKVNIHSDYTWTYAVDVRNDNLKEIGENTYGGDSDHVFDFLFESTIEMEDGKLLTVDRVSSIAKEIQEKYEASEWCGFNINDLLEEDGRITPENAPDYDACNSFRHDIQNEIYNSTSVYRITMGDVIVYERELTDEETESIKTIIYY